jgi:flagellar protein FlaF
MGFSVSAATAIIFAGIIILVGAMAGTVFNVYGELKDAALDISNSEFERGRTRIAILNSSYNTTAVFINASNTGEITLDTGYVDLLLNGTIHTEKITKKQVGGTASKVWAVHEVLYLEITYDSANNDTRIKLITENGVSGSKKMK